MTDRRTTITRNWRPPGAPARRIDDFQEVAADATPAPPMVAEKAPEYRPDTDIARRLENWGAWANARGSRGPDCMTGAVCDGMRRSELGDVWSGHQVRERIDAQDAERIQLAFARLPREHREVLHWCYIMGAKEGVVAAVCGFPRREYGERLEAAQAAIANIAERMDYPERR